MFSCVRSASTWPLVKETGSDLTPPKPQHSECVCIQMGQSIVGPDLSQCFSSQQHVSVGSDWFTEERIDECIVAILSEPIKMSLISVALQPKSSSSLPAIHYM